MYNITVFDKIRSIKTATRAEREITEVKNLYIPTIPRLAAFSKNQCFMLERSTVCLSHKIL
jgi:dTDP-glucose pyrophosphorylase